MNKKKKTKSNFFILCVYCLQRSLKTNTTAGGINRRRLLNRPGAITASQLINTRRRPLKRSNSVSRRTAT